MRIAHVTSHFAPNLGGIETHVAEIARHVAGRGHQVDVLTQDTLGGSPAIEEVDGITIRRFPVARRSRHYPVSPGLWRHLRRAARDYDLVHAHNYHGVAALGAALAGSRPLVFTPHYHGTGHSPFRALLHLPYRRVGAAIFARAQRVICVSRAEAALVARHFPAAAAKTSVIPNGVELERFAAAEPYPDEPGVVLTASRLEPYKRVDLAIEAVAHLPLPYRLKVAGAGSAREALGSLAARLGLGDRVEFLERVDDESLRRWLRTAEVFVSMSEQEAFGSAVAEAVVAGAGVAASDIPAHREMTASAPPGRIALVPRDAPPQALARTIEALADRRRTAGAGEGAGEHGIASWAEVGERTLAVYASAVA